MYLVLKYKVTDKEAMDLLMALQDGDMQFVAEVIQLEAPSEFRVEESPDDSWA